MTGLPGDRLSCFSLAHESLYEEANPLPPLLHWQGILDSLPLFFDDRQLFRNRFAPVHEDPG